MLASTHTTQCTHTNTHAHMLEEGQEELLSNESDRVWGPVLHAMWRPPVGNGPAFCMSSPQRTGEGCYGRRGRPPVDPITPFPSQASFVPAGCLPAHTQCSVVWGSRLLRGSYVQLPSSLSAQRCLCPDRPNEASAASPEASMLLQVGDLRSNTNPDVAPPGLKVCRHQGEQRFLRPCPTAPLGSQTYRSCLTCFLFLTQPKE